MGSSVHVKGRASPRLAGFLKTGTLTWFANGGLWTAWVLTTAAGSTAEARLGWGMVVVLSLLWLAAVTVDWLERLGAVEARVAELARAGFLGAAMLATPLALENPAGLLPYWLTAVVTLGALMFAAPLLTDRSTRAEVARFVGDARLAVGLAGVALFVVVLVGAGAAPLGFALSPTTFASLLAAASFGVLPTAFTRLRTASRPAVRV